MRRKIVIIIPDFSLGGAQRVVSLLLAEWVKFDKIFLITLSDNKSDFFEIPDSVERLGLNLMRESSGIFGAIKSNWRRIITIRKTIQQIQPDVVISFLSSMNILTILALMGRKTKLIICERADPIKQPMKKVWRLLQRWLYRYADKVTTNSMGVKEMMAQYVSENKLNYIPNPIKVEKVSNVQRQQRILSVGRLHYEKGYDILIRAFYQSKLFLSGWQLSIVGEGPDREDLENLIQQFNIQDYVSLHGRQQDVSQFYKSAGIFVLPSRTEGMPNALLEAMSYAMPIIVSDASPGPLEYIKNNENGMTFHIEDEQTLAFAMTTLAEKEALRQKFSDKIVEALSQNEMSHVMAVWDDVIKQA